jgi:oligoribonuclease
MIYVSIDLETTGLIAGKHQIIEFAAIIEDSKNPLSFDDSKKFRRTILSLNGEYVFSSFAAKLNAEIMAEIADIENGKAKEYVSTPTFDDGYCVDTDLIRLFKNWLLQNGFQENKRGLVPVVAAGKNFKGFDEQFLSYQKDIFGTFEKMPIESHGLVFLHRTIDPAGYYIDWDNDSVPPSTETCKERAGLPKQVKHRALNDAWDIITLLRKRYVK